MINYASNGFIDPSLPSARTCGWRTAVLPVGTHSHGNPWRLPTLDSHHLGHRANITKPSNSDRTAAPAAAVPCTSAFFPARRSCTKVLWGSMDRTRGTMLHGGAFLGTFRTARWDDAFHCHPPHDSLEMTEWAAYIGMKPRCDSPSRYRGSQSPHHAPHVSGPQRSRRHPREKKYRKHRQTSSLATRDRAQLSCTAATGVSQRPESGVQRSTIGTWNADNARTQAPTRRLQPPACSESRRAVRMHLPAMREADRDMSAPGPGVTEARCRRRC